MTASNLPHGGTLIDRTFTPAEADGFGTRTASLRTIPLADFEVTDLFQIALGGYSPLIGFQNEADYLAVIDGGKLADGKTPWSIPITLGVTDAVRESLSIGERVALADANGKRLGELHIESIFRRRLDAEADGVFRTRDENHPGVARIRAAGQWLIGGAVRVVPDVLPADFHGLEYRPAAIRAEIERRGWKTIVAFQTRNPIHRAHEHLIRTALETADGVLIHPLVGETKADDLPADVRVKCYRTLIAEYFPTDRVILAALPVAMRYAGPKEAIHHALIRKNYGATRFIVGRDHAGVGNYYGSYDAQKIFATYSPEALGIENLNFENVSYCTKTGAFISSKTGPADPATKIFVSGTKLRALFAAGEAPPIEVVRPEIAAILSAYYQATPEPVAVG